MNKDPSIDPVVKLVDMELNLSTMKAIVYEVEGVSP